jgi:HK97 family phage portal protein
MSYFGNLLRAVTGRPAASSGASYDLANMSPEQVREFIRIGGSMETASGVHVSETTAMRVAAAWRCVNIIAGTIGTLSLDLVRRESDDVRRPATGHPLRRVLTVKPNQWQTPSEFRRVMQAHLLTRGNAYALKVMSGNAVVGLIPIHPEGVMVDQLNDYSMDYRVTLKDGSVRRFTQAEIFHLRGLSFDGVKGLSVLSHMRESIGLALRSEMAGAEIMRNGQVSGGAFSHPNKLSPEAFGRLRAQMQERRSGGSRAGETLLLEEGMKYEPIAMTAKDLQFLEQRDFQRYDIAMFFGVPPHMIGATDKTTSWGSGIEQQGIGFVTYTLADWLKTWEDAIKRDLIQEREWETLDARFYTQSLMRGDVKTRWEAYTKALQWGVMSPNEVRTLEDQNPREGGDLFYDPPNTAGTSQGERDVPAQPA